MNTQNYTPEQQLLLDQFKSGMSEESAIAQLDRIRGLEAEIETLKAEGARPEVGDELIRLQGERDAAIERAEAAEKDRDHHKSKATALAKQVPPSPRKLGTLGAGKGIAGDDQAERVANLQAAIADADEVEIAFSDGRHEVRGLAPQGIAGEGAWKVHPAGLMLTTPVTLHGPAAGHTSFVVNGYALVLDGKQVAYATASEPHHVAANASIKLENEIVFA